MPTPDFNLLITLDVLLSEGSVANAARRLRLSPSAMSRALARLRETLGDPLLIRAGRVLVPTPRALALRERVAQLVQETTAVLRPSDTLNLARLERSFTLRSSDGFVENFAPPLIARVREQAPGVRLCFVQKINKDGAPLRDGSIDLEIGVVDDATSPELRTRALFRDRYIGVVRSGHSLSTGKISAARYADGAHILVSRRGLEKSLLEEAFAALRVTREIVTIVGGFAAALAIARGSDLIATVPERHTGNLRADMFSFPLPLATAEFTVSMLWHPRMDADAAHAWLRDAVRMACRGPLEDDAG
ncbi:MAG: LysR family transcriptional regulator [Tahibacter sp.]